MTSAANTCPRSVAAETHGKAESFNGCLTGSFLVPLAATLRQAGLKPDLTAANTHSGPYGRTSPMPACMASLNVTPLI